jgi:hypothetical protein
VLRFQQCLEDSKAETLLLRFASWWSMSDQHGLTATTIHVTGVYTESPSEPIMTWKVTIKQFENVFIMMNENRQVVVWRLTKTTAFEEIKHIFQDFKSVLYDDLELVIVDDCFRVRALYQSIFPHLQITREEYSLLKKE